MKYNNHLNYKKRQRFLFRVRISVALLLVVLAAGGLMFYLKYVREDNPNTVESTTTQATTSTVASSINIFRSPYFQFQATKNWVEVPNESDSNKFVYRSLRANLIEHELIIYVNQIPANLQANRVLPVTLKNSDSEMVPQSVSDHCVKELDNKPTIKTPELVIDGVKLKCDADSTNYTVLVGIKDDDTVLNMIRPAGTVEAYAIYYTNLRALPDASELIQIVSTFQAR